jgi:plasmid stabilization system protein ParE
MPQIIISASAVRDLEKVRNFLRPKNPAASKRAASAIIKAIRSLENYPLIGRPADDIAHDCRELLIDFGDSGYVALYHYSQDRVVIISIKHQKEVGY